MPPLFVFHRTFLWKTQVIETILLHLGSIHNIKEKSFIFE
jgi:hypothetical protein